MISRNGLQQNIESSIDYDAIPVHLKKQIHKIMDEWICSCSHNKAMIIGKLDELSQLPKEVIAGF